MDIVRRALLGDKKAQEELTEKGELLPCPICGNNFLTSGHYTKSMSGFDYVSCTICGIEFIEVKSPNLYNVIRQWNARPQILMDEEMERLTKE